MVGAAWRSNAAAVDAVGIAARLPRAGLAGGARRRLRVAVRVVRAPGRGGAVRLLRPWDVGSRTLSPGRVAGVAHRPAVRAARRALPGDRGRSAPAGRIGRSVRPGEAKHGPDSRHGRRKSRRLHRSAGQARAAHRRFRGGGLPARTARPRHDRRPHADLRVGGGRRTGRRRGPVRHDAPSRAAQLATRPAGAARQPERRGDAGTRAAVGRCNVASNARPRLAARPAQAAGRPPTGTRWPSNTRPALPAPARWAAALPAVGGRRSGCTSPGRSPRRASPPLADAKATWQVDLAKIANIAHTRCKDRKGG